MNDSIIFVRVWGQLVNIKDVELVQKSPNSGQIVAIEPLKNTIARLIRLNTIAGIQEVKDLKTFNRKPHVSELPKSE